jgi:hypothetical protein
MVRFNVPSLRGANATEIEQAFVDRNNITISRDALGGYFTEPVHGTDSTYRSQCLRPDQLGNKVETKRLFDEYFSTWHPLLPFLDGKIAFIYLNRSFDANLTDAGDAEALIMTAIISSIVGIGALGQADVATNEVPGFSAARTATSMAYTIVDACDESLVNDIEGIQALVTITLYLYATRKHRQASHLCGVIISECDTRTLLTRHRTSTGIRAAPLSRTVSRTICLSGVQRHAKTASLLDLRLRSTTRSRARLSYHAERYRHRCVPSWSDRETRATTG